MPIITGTATAVTNLASEIERQLSSSGNAARATIGDKAEAFAWTSGLVPWPRVFNGVLVEGLQFRSITVKSSATPVAIVPPGGQKPNAATIVSASAQLPKYSGYGQLTTEQIVDSAGIIAALETVLVDQALTAFGADLAAALATTTVAASGASWSAAVLAGIAAVPGADLLIVSSADYAAVVADLVAAGFMVSGADGVGSVLGLAVLPLPGAPAGTAYVCRASAVTVFESQSSPIAIADPYSLSDTNQTRIVVDVFAAASLTNGLGVAKVTVAGP